MNKPWKVTHWKPQGPSAWVGVQDEKEATETTIRFEGAPSIDIRFSRSIPDVAIQVEKMLMALDFVFEAGKKARSKEITALLRNDS